MDNIERIRELSKDRVNDIISEALCNITGYDKFINTQFSQFMDSFHEYMNECFSSQDSINGNSFELIFDNEIEEQVSEINYERICKKIKNTFEVSSIVIRSKDLSKFFEDKYLKKSYYHNPLIIAYDLSKKELFSVLIKIGDNANIIWIHRREY